jgi:pimeloyl-ACP methyl ester carboxylesterase
MILLARLRLRFLLYSVALVAVLAPAGVFAAPPGIPDGWSDGYVYANGVRLHYYHAKPAPGKPVIVMVHGVTDIGLCWTTLTWKLEEAYDIYMLDTRGHGLSDPFTPSDDGTTLVKDVIAFVESMKFEKPILMGHSMGAATLIRLGAEYPDLPKALILLDPGLGRVGPRPPRPSETAAPKAGTEASGTDTAAKPTPPRTAPDRLRVSMIGSPEELVAQNNYSFDDLVATCRRQTPKWDLVDCQYWALSKKQYHGAYTPEAWKVMQGVMGAGDALSRIQVPTLVLKADAPADARKTNEEAARALKHGKLVHIDGAGHNLHHDELARTVEVLNEFLQTL